MTVDLLAPPERAPWQHETVPVEAGMDPWLIALIAEMDAAKDDAANNLERRLDVVRSGGRV